MISAFSCDREDCDTKQGLNHHHDYIPDGWFLVRDDDDQDFHFCSKDCLMFWASKSTPTEAVPASWMSQSAMYGPTITPRPDWKIFMDEGKGINDSGLPDGDKP